MRGDFLGEPVLQLDVHELDSVELVLGGLVDPSCLDHQFSVDSRLPRQGTPSGAELNEATFGIVLADPDGTPLARLTGKWTADSGEPKFRIAALEPLANIEHGPYRSRRLSSPLQSSPVALFNSAPTPVQLADLRQRTGSGEALHLVLVASGDRARGSDYAEVMQQLIAAASLHEHAVAGHLVIPESLDAVAVLHRFSDHVIADYRGGDAPLPVLDGLVVMLSGLSGSGKSTLARAFQEAIHAHSTRRAVLLDGDDIRRFISKGLGFSLEDRETNVQRIGWIAARISQVGGIALCAPIAPFEHARSVVRSMAEEVGTFCLVHVSTPLDVCEARDRKGLYAKARAGLLSDFTGIDSPYQIPENAELTIDLSRVSIAHGVEMLLEFVGLPRPAPLIP